MNRTFFLWTVVAALFGAHDATANQYDDLNQPAEEEESLPAPTPDGATDAKATPSTTNQSSLPYTPYPAGLPWVITPQAFRVPIPDRIYYPPHTYVRRCPYYPRGYYWGANWRFNVIGRGNLLFFGPFRFNPYLTAAKARHNPELRGQRRYAPPPGPVGQAILLGVEPMPPGAMPHAIAKRAPSHSGEEAQVAAVRKAPERRPAQTASNRRKVKQTRTDNSR